MRLLLDTHVFLWYISGDSRLVSQQTTLRDPANEVFLSAVSVWEATIKCALGKLSLPATPAVYLRMMRERHAIETLPLDEASVARLASLPDLHRDPFDRILVCQALEHNLTFMTADKIVVAYPVSSIPLV
ncbi:MAG: type II toxin-antitoxin system VapC family toxin [Planctomycetes bacterium]|nr:type II toxin-antitoxin system VapC family toxin [Planctomycetota bacterium]